MIIISLSNCLFIEALKEIHYYQMQSGFILSKAAFCCLVCEVITDEHPEFHWQATTIDALQIAAELTLTTLFECK